MKSKVGKRGNVRMQERQRKKLEVWLDPKDFDALKKLADDQGRPVAELVRVLIRYVGRGGTTAALILDGVCRDRGAV